MQKLYEFGFSSNKHFSQLKKLWNEVFGDPLQVIDSFFEKTVKPQNVFCAFYDGEPVSVLYAIESQVFFNGKSYKSYYVYAVCTKEGFRGKGLSSGLFKLLEKTARERDVSYLYLVPAEEGLFTFYEKMGYSTCFTYKEACVQKGVYPELDYQCEALTFDEYKRIKSNNLNVPYTAFNKDGFNGFYNYAENDMHCVYLKDEGFAVYETDNGKVIVHECIGNKGKLLSCIFSEVKNNVLYVREQALTNGKPYGMLKSLDGSPLFSNGFIGVSYGG